MGKGEWRKGGRGKRKGRRRNGITANKKAGYEPAILSDIPHGNNVGFSDYSQVAESGPSAEEDGVTPKELVMNVRQSGQLSRTAKQPLQTHA